MTTRPSSSAESSRFQQLCAALRAAASALKADGPDFALAGSFSLWAHGAPEPDHDVDVVVDETQTEAAVATLASAGFTIERVPEDWLFKAHHGDVVVDILHRVNGIPVTAALLDTAAELEVLAIAMPVLPPTVVMTQKLRALNEHNCDFAHLLPPVRAVREALDWAQIATDIDGNAYAEAFLFLTERLGLR